MIRAFRSAALLSLAAAIGFADVTVRYTYDVQPGAMLPPQAAEAMKAQMKQVLGSSTPMQLKGNRAVTGVVGLISISDFDGEIITLVDPRTSRYATAQKDEYLRAFLKAQDERMKNMPEQARKAMAQVKTDVKSELTGRTELIKGIQTEERLVTMTVSIPGAPTMRMLLSCWIPKSEEMERNPVLREWRLFVQRAYQGTGPGSAAEKMLSQTPGSASASQIMSAFRESPVILRMKMSMALPRRPGAADSAAPSAPAIEMTMDVDELSAAALPDSLFQVPRGYTAIGIDEMLAGMHEHLKPKPPSAAPAAH